MPSRESCGWIKTGVLAAWLNQNSKRQRPRAGAPAPHLLLSEYGVIWFAQEVPGFQVLGPWVLAAESWGREQKASASCDYAYGQDVPDSFEHQVGDYEI